MVTEDDLTVLSDSSRGGRPSDREVAAELLPRIREELSEEEYREFRRDLRGIVVEAILDDLTGNLEHEDWSVGGFEDAADYLDAGEVVEFIETMTEWYFQDDQTGKSSRVMQVIFEYAEHCGLVERGPE